jgi:ATP-binding cassette subfamily B protein
MPGKRIPFVQQTSEMDCGLACMAMVLGYHGRKTRIEELRHRVGRGRYGSTMLDLLTAARRLGLDGHGVRVGPDEVQHLDPGAILHWKKYHFVVFERFHGDRVDILDPGLQGGRASLTLEEFNRDFSQLALLLEPTDAFVPGGTQTRSPTLTWLGERLKRSRYVRILVTTGFLQLVGLAIPLVTGAVVDRVLPRGDVGLLAVLAAGFACVLLAQFIATIVRAHLLLELRSRLDFGLHFSFIRRLVDLPLAFFLQRHSGDLMSRYGTTAEVRQFLTNSVLTSLLDGVLASFYFVLLMMFSPSMALTTIGVALLLMVVFLATRRPLRDVNRRSLEAASRSMEGVTELVMAMQDLKAMGTELDTMDEWVPVHLRNLDVSAEKARLEVGIESIRAVLNTSAPFVLLAFGARMVLEGSVSLGTMLSLWTLSQALLAPLASLINTVSEFQRIVTATERIDEIFLTPEEQPPGAARQELELDGSITLEQVSFRYAPDAPPVLHDVSLSIAPGQMVALVGRSGSGKSTLSMLLLGLYQPSSGTVSYNGADVRTLDLRALRKQLGVVLQQPHIFAGTVRENVLRLAPGLSDEEIHEVLRAASLEEDVAALPAGLDTVMPTGGTTLSGGQRQRLAIARALARRPRILLLDEATSALDAITEHRVQQALGQLECTRVVIAHRLSTIVNADVIIVMDGGRVVERGRHAELLALGGVYAELVRMQLSGGESGEA